MAVNIERLKAMAKPRDERAHKEFLDSWGNNAWLTYSQDIATLETICKIQQVIGEQLISVNKPYENPSIIRLAKPYVAPEDVEVSQVYRTVIKPRNRFQRASVRTCAY